MKRQWKGFFCGILITLMVISLVGPVAATVGKRAVELAYNDIKVTMNGSQVNLVDAKGNPVEPFVIDGTTYLPVRAVASALGLDVGWDGATSTVKLTSKASTPTGTLIMDKNDVKIYYDGIAENTSYLGGYKIKIRVENNSARNYRVRVENLSVNGIMVDEYTDCTVASGKTANSNIVIWKSNLDESGITGPITSAEFRFNIYDSDDYGHEFYSDIIEI